MKIKQFFCFLFLFLAACGGGVGSPVYQNTTYSPPMTPGGRLCMEQCSKSRDYCQESCKLDHRACYNDVQLSAQRDYDKYARQHFNDHMSADLMPHDFEHPEACNDEKKTCFASCDHPYDSCYRSCGGTVNTTTSCQFLCFE